MRFATHFLGAVYDIRTVQKQMGHNDVKATQIYTHVLQRGGAAVRSPLDALFRGTAQRDEPCYRRDAFGRALEWRGINRQPYSRRVIFLSRGVWVRPWQYSSLFLCRAPNRPSGRGLAVTGHPARRRSLHASPRAYRDARVRRGFRARYRSLSRISIMGALHHLRDARDLAISFTIRDLTYAALSSTCR